MIREPIRDVVNTNHNLIASIQAVSNGLPEIGVKKGLRVGVDDAFGNIVVMAMLAPSRACYRFIARSVGRKEGNRKTMLACQLDNSPSA